ncbi:hypothetical protein C8Q77DRAFT_1110228 [Trametes polyzona]|nr:hypothetical protein C8Q77DRAFT_1110228 [Trametes polyzona]
MDILTHYRRPSPCTPALECDTRSATALPPSRCLRAPPQPLRTHGTRRTGCLASAPPVAPSLHSTAPSHAPRLPPCVLCVLGSTTRSSSTR